MGKNKFRNRSWISPLLVSLLVIIQTVAFGYAADNPRIIPFQGRLTDTSGNPLNDVYTIYFTIWDKPTGGNPLWSEIHSTVSVINGQFNVLLGTMTNLDDPDNNGDLGDAVGFAEPRFLGIKVGADTNQEMVPRQQLVPSFHARRADYATTAGDADYAATAGDADKLDGLDSSAFVTKALNDTFSIDTSDGYLRLLRDGSANFGGNLHFLELRQEDITPPEVPSVYPAIGFHHPNRFWNRIEGRETGIHFKFHQTSDEYVDIYARNLIGVGGMINLRTSTGHLWEITPDWEHEGTSNRGIRFVYDTNCVPLAIWYAGVNISKLHVEGDINANGRIFRRGTDFSQTGVATNEQIVTAPWGTTDDWNIFVSLRMMGTEEATSETDNSLLKIECYASVYSANQWQVTAKYKFDFWPDQDIRTGEWRGGTANYILIPK